MPHAKKDLHRPPPGGKRKVKPGSSAGTEAQLISRRAAQTMSRAADRKPRRGADNSIYQTPAGRWKAQLTHKGQCRYLGVYGTKTEARNVIERERAKVAKDRNYVPRIVSAPKLAKARRRAPKKRWLARMRNEDAKRARRSSR